MDMVKQSVATRTLNILASITGTDEVKKNQELKLFEIGILDSLGAVQLMVALSEEFGIEISPSELERDDISTPQKIVRFMEARMG
jgi:D-alanine--poly(phosphoribitol) ligase subunit 2